MTPTEVFEALAIATDRAGALRSIDATDARAAVEFLLDRAAAIGIADLGELLLLIVQRFDFALVDLELADRYRLAPSITESQMEPELATLARSLLGTEPSPSYLEALVRRTRIAARRLENRGDPVDEASVVEGAVGNDGSLRCAYCGYHFMLEDVREKLLNQVSPERFTWATTISAARLRDPWKPVRTTNRQGEVHPWTTLEIEHRVPEVALGPSSSDNLTIACRWCNQGKTMFRSYAEIVPGNLAVCLSSLHEEWSLRYVQRAFYAAVTRAGRCEACGSTARQQELTVRARQVRAGLRAPAWPSVLCYACQST